MKAQIIYSNVRAEMARRNITISMMAECLGVNRDTMSNKLSNKTRINLDEAFKIQKKFFPDVGVENLFAELLHLDINPKTSKPTG